MSNHNTPNQKDDALIWQRLDERMTPEEFALFNERLLTDAEFRKRYIYLADLEAVLHDEVPQQVQPSRATDQPHKRRSSFSRWTLAAISLACIAAFAFALRSYVDSDVKPDGGLAKSGDGDSGEPMTTFKAATAEEFRDAAVVVRLNDISNQALYVGRRLKPGILDLVEGSLQLEFMSGAVISLSAPARLQIESQDSATILAGQASARVPDRARGFVLNAPHAAVVDLGTEFGVRVDETGTAEVEVLSGEVELSLLGDDGNTLFSKVVVEEQNVRVDAKQRALVSVAESDEALPEIVAVDCSPLNVGPDYVSCVLDAEPIVFWRFEEETDSVVKNEMSPSFCAKIVLPDEDPDVITIANGQAMFGKSTGLRYLVTEDAIPDLNTKPYTLEFWMRPDSLGHRTCLGIFPEEDPNAHSHLNVIELSMNTTLVHDPGAIRFLHRSPPANTSYADTNAFTSGVCTPGKWQHVVAIKTDTTLELFFNGQLARRVAVDKPHNGGRYRVIVGQLNLWQDWRQFTGAMDEISIYPRALSAKEVQQHFELMGLYNDGLR